MQAAHKLAEIIDTSSKSHRQVLIAAGVEVRSSTPADELRVWHHMIRSKCDIDWTAVVEQHLRHWKPHGFHMRDLRAYCTLEHSVFVSVVDSEVRYAFYWRNQQANLISTGRGFLRVRPKTAMWLLQLAYLRAKILGNPIPDVELVIDPQDSANTKMAHDLATEPVPLFSSVDCEKQSMRSGPAVPFPIIVQDMFGFFNGRASLALYEQLFENLQLFGTRPWNEKQSKLFFSASNDRGFRTVLFELAKQNQTIYDIFHQNIPLAKNTDYRYLVYAHGNAGWSRRLRELLFMNATVFVEESKQCTEYFFDLLQPNVHYVPVAEDFSDLDNKFKHMLEHPDESERMASAWGRLGSQIFSLECTLSYIEALLRGYALLQRDKPVVRERWHRFTFDTPPNTTLFDVPGPVGSMCDTIMD